MNELYEWKKKLQELYYSKSRYIDWGIKFIIGLLIFTYINNNVGYMSSLNKFVVVFALSAIGCILPYGFLLVMAPVMILLHIFSASMALAGCVAVVFLMMFIVYFRFTADRVLVVILTPIAIVMNIGYVVPIACGLLVGPAAIVPVSCGVVVYSLINVIQGITIVGELSVDGILADAMAFAYGLLENKEMIYYIVVLSITICVVYGVKLLPINHIWKYAAGAGCLTSIIMGFSVASTLEIQVSPMALIFGNVLAMLIGLVVEFVFLGVDYKKTEVVEFEDDEYHYYVKAIPKIGYEKKKRVRRKRRVEQKPEVVEEEYPQENLEGYSEEYQEEYPEEYQEEYSDGIPEELLQEPSEEYTDGYTDSYSEEESLAYMSDQLEEDMSELNGYTNDEDYGLTKGETMIIETDDIERELRSNARTRTSRNQALKSKHARTNYSMLKKSMEQDFEE